MADADVVRQFMAMAEQQIGVAFVQNGLHVHILRTFQGPFTITTALRLYVPTPSNLAKALRLGPVVEAMIGDAPVRIYTDHGVVCVEVPSPWPVHIPGRCLRGRGLAVPLGMTSRRTIEGIDFEQSPHLLIVGPTGRGKTTAARAIAFHLVRQNHPGRVQLLAVTFKPADWRALGGLAHTMAVIADPQEAAAALRWLRDTMHSRTTDGANMPHLFAFVDDLLNLLAVSDVTGDLAEIASLGRAAGVHLVIGTQRLGKRGAGDAAVTGNMPGRLVFGTADAQDSAFFTGRADAGAERLGRYPGDALLITDGGTVRLAVAPVGDADLGDLLQNAKSTSGEEWRPWLACPVARHRVTSERGSDNGATAINTPSREPVTNRLPWRTPTAEEKAALRRLYADLGSKNKVLEVAYGGKNGQTLAWLNQALEEVT
jgi:DNA polymerase III delta prime subunit